MACSLEGTEALFSTLMLPDYLWLKAVILETWTRFNGIHMTNHEKKKNPELFNHILFQIQEK